jgi:hypothetical protein
MQHPWSGHSLRAHDRFHFRGMIAPPRLRTSMLYSLSGSPSAGTSYHHFSTWPSTAHRPALTRTSTSSTSS